MFLKWVLKSHDHLNVCQPIKPMYIIVPFSFPIQINKRNANKNSKLMLRNIQSAKIDIKQKADFLRKIIIVFPFIVIRNENQGGRCDLYSVY